MVTISVAHLFDVTFARRAEKPTQVYDSTLSAVWCIFIV